jgi:hypothetical protein
MTKKKISTESTLRAKTDIYVVEYVPESYEDEYPYKVGDHVLLMGIENMPGHVAVVTREGRVVWGYHPEDFRKLTVDET